MAKLFWDESKINEVIERYNNGETIKSIADSMGGNAISLSRKLRCVYGIDCRKVTTSDLVVKFLQDHNGEYYKICTIAKAINNPAPRVSVALFRELSKDKPRVVKILGRWGYNNKYDDEFDSGIEVESEIKIKYDDIVTEHKRFVKSVIEQREKRMKANLWQLHA